MEKLNKDEIFSIALHLDLPDLLNFSCVNKRINKSIRDELWLYKLESEFVDFRNLNLDKTFKEIYILLYYLKQKFPTRENIYDIYESRNIDLSDQKLKNVSKELCKLTNLTTLHLDCNWLTVIPKEISNLFNLRRLNLSNNMLNVLPKELGDLSNLVYLNLSHNHLKEIPKELGNLINLTILDLSCNRLTFLPEELGELSRLVSLFLDFIVSANIGKNNEKINIYKFRS